MDTLLLAQSQFLSKNEIKTKNRNLGSHGKYFGLDETETHHYNTEQVETVNLANCRTLCNEAMWMDFESEPCVIM